MKSRAVNLAAMARTMAYKLTEKAQSDILTIFAYTTREFGFAQAEKYHTGLEGILDFLAEYPRAARERFEITPPVRIHPYKSHLIVYTIEGKDILVIRVMHGKEDWMDGHE